MPTPATIRLSADGLESGGRPGSEDATGPYPRAADAFSAGDKCARQEADMDSTSCTNSHASSLSERQELDESDGDDADDEMKGVAALRGRGVTGGDADGDGDTPKGMPGFDLNTVCDEGKTLLWDLIQDHNAVGTG